MKRDSRDKIWLSIQIIPTLLIAMLAFILNPVLILFLAMIWFTVVTFAWWAESKAMPYELRCLNCKTITEGTIGTFFFHLHNGPEVYMRCPNCGQRGIFFG